MFQKLSTFLFITILALPGLFVLLESQQSKTEREALERRRLAEFPTIAAKSITDFPSKFDSFANDNFGFRSALVSLQGSLRYYVFGDLPNSRYIRGKDGWFFRGTGKQRVEKGELGNYNELLDYSGGAPLSGPEIVSWREEISRRVKVCGKLGASYIFGIAPSKSSVYPEFLPTIVRSTSGITRRAQLQNALEKSSPNHIADLHTALVQGKAVNRFPRLFYKTDAHWNHYGAYFAYAAFIKQASIANPALNLSPIPLEAFSIAEKENWSHRGFKAETTLDISERYPILTPKADTPYASVIGIRSASGDVDEGSDVVSKGRRESLTRAGVGAFDMPSVRIRYRGKQRFRKCRYLENSGVTSLDTIVLLGDSFLEKAAPYFSAHAKHLYFCRQTTGFQMPSYDQKRNVEIKPQLVMQEVLQSYLGDRATKKNKGSKRKRPARKRAGLLATT